jgi:dipeptidase D
MSKEVRNLEPSGLWNSFADLNAVPRASKKEERVIAWAKGVGESLGFETIVDATGNVVIKKPATAGMENRQTVIMQSHLDMVHQKNSDTNFDFATEGIKMMINGDWVKADGTTLGADNGIGVAAIMAVLKATDIVHPAIEALFTIDEETGMTGAKELDKTILTGQIMLNLDTEEDNELCIGCAGDMDTNTTMRYEQKAPKSNDVAYQLSVTGLKGGHSGMEIHKGLGNANKLMNRLLYKMSYPFGLHVATIDGGSLRNAIPRESFATFVVAGDKKAAFLAEFEARKAAIVQEFASMEPDLSLELATTPMPEKVAFAADQERMFQAIYAIPNGVFRMSPDIADLVETSNNLARVVVKDGQFITQSLQRSSTESGKYDICNMVAACFESIGATVNNDGDYPGWAPNAKSPVLKEMAHLYEEMFNEKPHIAACHAGLECGIIMNRYPGLDAISFGPTIRGAHSPDETVSVSSVQKFWGFLMATLKNTPSKN